jgi:hypothetical protein
VTLRAEVAILSSAERLFGPAYEVFTPDSSISSQGVEHRLSDHGIQSAEKDGERGRNRTFNLLIKRHANAQIQLVH